MTPAAAPYSALIRTGHPCRPLPFRLRLPRPPSEKSASAQKGKWVFGAYLVTRRQALSRLVGVLPHRWGFHVDSGIKEPPPFAPLSPSVPPPSAPLPSSALLLLPAPPPPLSCRCRCPRSCCRPPCCRCPPCLTARVVAAAFVAATGCLTSPSPPLAVAAVAVAEAAAVAPANGSRSRP